MKIKGLFVVGMMALYAHPSHAGSRAYIPIPSLNKVEVYDTATDGKIGEIINIPSAWGVAISSDGNKVYVSSPTTNKIYQINPSTFNKVQEVSIGSNKEPLGIALSANDSKLYVVNRKGSNLEIFDTSNLLLAPKSIPVGFGSNPYGIVTNNSGNIFVTAEIAPNSSFNTAYDLTGETTAKNKFGSIPTRGVGLSESKIFNTFDSYSCPLPPATGACTFNPNTEGVLFSVDANAFNNASLLNYGYYNSALLITNEGGTDFGYFANTTPTMAGKAPPLAGTDRISKFNTSTKAKIWDANCSEVVSMQMNKEGSKVYALRFARGINDPQICVINPTNGMVTNRINLSAPPPLSDLALTLPPTGQINAHYDPLFGKFTGVAPTVPQLDPSVSFSASSLDFGNVKPGSKNSQSLTVTFKDAPSSLANINSDNSAFTILNDGCGTTVHQPGESCTIDLEFSPQQAIAYSGNLLIDTFAGTQKVLLTGAGITDPIPPPPPPQNPDLSLSASSINFGEQIIQTKSNPQSVTLTYQGGTFSLGEIKLSNTTDFIIESNSCVQTPQPAGSTCQVTLSFLPENEGVIDGTLIVVTPNGTINLPLTGKSLSATGGANLNGAGCNLGTTSNNYLGITLFFGSLLGLGVLRNFKRERI